MDVRLLLSVVLMWEWWVGLYRIQVYPFSRPLPLHLQDAGSQPGSASPGSPVRAAGKAAGSDSDNGSPRAVVKHFPSFSGTTSLQSGSMLDLLGLGSDNASDNSSVRLPRLFVLLLPSKACALGRSCGCGCCAEGEEGRPPCKAAPDPSAPLTSSPSLTPLSPAPSPQVRNGLCNSLLIDPADMGVEDVLALHGAAHLPKVWLGTGCGDAWVVGQANQFVQPWACQRQLQHASAAACAPAPLLPRRRLTPRRATRPPLTSMLARSSWSTRSRCGRGAQQDACSQRCLLQTARAALPTRRPPTLHPPPTSPSSLSQAQPHSTLTSHPLPI